MNRYLFFLLMPVLALLAACREEQRVAEQKRPGKMAIRTVRADTVAVKPDSICIAAVGDIMLGTSYPDKSTLPPDSGKRSFVNVIKQLHADVTFGNLEGTLLDTGAAAHYKLHQLSKAYLFRMPVSYGKVLKQAGFNVLSLANNHIGDFGDPGRLSTMKTLDSCGINYGGLLDHPSAIFKIKGITYGFCAFAPNSNTLSILDLRASRRIIKKLKKQCDIVIVSFHGGGEGVAFEHVPLKMESYIKEKRGDVRAFAHNAIDAGADLIFGNGPHVSRAMELYKKRLVAYSLGNFCTYKSVSVGGVCGLAPLIKIYVNKNGEFLNGRIISFKQTHYKGLEFDPLNRAAARIRLLTAADFKTPGISIANSGMLSPKIEHPF